MWNILQYTRMVIHRGAIRYDTTYWEMQSTNKTDILKQPIYRPHCQMMDVYFEDYGENWTRYSGIDNDVVGKTFKKPSTHIYTYILKKDIAMSHGPAVTIWSICGEHLPRNIYNGISICWKIFEIHKMWTSIIKVLCQTWNRPAWSLCSIWHISKIFRLNLPKKVEICTLLEIPNYGNGQRYNE